jgi:hypothetical protein
MVSFVGALVFVLCFSLMSALVSSPLHNCAIFVGTFFFFKNF